MDSRTELGDNLCVKGVLTPGPTGILEFGPFQFFPDGRFLRDGRRVPLSPKEWGVLRVLAGASGALVTKESLLSQVWPGETVSDASLVRAIYGLRRRLGLTDAGVCTWANQLVSSKVSAAVSPTTRLTEPSISPRSNS